MANSTTYAPRYLGVKSEISLALVAGVAVEAEGAPVNRATAGDIAAILPGIATVGVTHPNRSGAAAREAPAALLHAHAGGAGVVGHTCGTRRTAALAVSAAGGTDRGHAIALGGAG